MRQWRSLALHNLPLTKRLCNLIDKATDENLTSEDWGAIIDICDRVSADPNGPKESVQSLIKRLAHRNANVQLYTLEVKDMAGFRYYQSLY